VVGWFELPEWTTKPFRVWATDGQQVETHPRQDSLYRRHHVPRLAYGNASAETAPSDASGTSLLPS
jgi:hypothetical protein